MPRTIVYGRDCQPVEAPPPDDKADLLQPKSAGTPRKKKKPAAEEAAAVAARQPDGYGEKLLKYIPAEVVAFYAPIATLVDAGKAAHVAIFLLGLGGTVVHALVRAKREGLHPPVAHFVLVGCAFVAWACGTGNFLTLVFGVGAVWNKIVLAGAVFLLPAIDELWVKGE